MIRHFQAERSIMMITVIRILNDADRRTIIINDEVKDLSPLARTFLAAVRKMTVKN
jgi:hypothetical protein